MVTSQGWFATRPSGTEDIFNICAESLVSADHLPRLQEEAIVLVSKTFIASGV